ncbi:FK506-binding protein 4 [Diutina catenulata]
MASLLPIATYNLALKPFDPQPAISEEFPITIRITGAAIDPDAVDENNQPSTLRILKKSDDDIDDEYGLSDDEDDEDDEEEEEEEEEKPKKGKKAAKKAEEEAEDEDDEDEEDDEEDISEYVVCTLSPNGQFQVPLDITISPEEEVYFVATGSYPIHLHGNYVEHPADDSDEDDFDSEDEEDELDAYYDDDEGEYDEAKIQELLDNEASEDDDEEEEEPEQKPSKKRAAPQEDAKSKKAKKAVQFTKELEQGPTGSTFADEKKDKKEKKEKKDKKVEKKEEKKEETSGKKYPTKTLLGGVITEDRKVGKGPAAKTGHKVGIRYVGKLSNGKVFDKNTSGKPFTFGLGKGECIKGFDLGVTGMAVGGERRVVIPAKMGYGSQKLPGIPANSELTFDIKLVSLK